MKKIITLSILICNYTLISQTVSQIYDSAGTYTFVVPAGVNYLKVETWGAGGGGGAASYHTLGEGGGGGAYARIDSVTVIPLSTHIIVVGIGGMRGLADGYMSSISNGIDGGNSSFDSTLVFAKSGYGGTSSNGIGGLGGADTSCIGNIRFSGGKGTTVPYMIYNNGGGGGGSAGINSNGNNGGDTTFNHNYGGIAVTGGGAGGNGGAYPSGSHPGWDGQRPGGGGGGAKGGTTGSSGSGTYSAAGANGADGQVIITYTNPATVGINENTGEALVTISPNPFSLQTTITFNEEQRNTTIKITDLLGKEMKTINFKGRQLVIEKGEMKAGIYFVQTTDERQHICNKKIIIQ